MSALSTANASSPPAVASRARLTLLLGCLGVFIVFLDTTIVMIAFRAIGDGFDTTSTRLPWVLNAYTLAFTAALIPAGRIADRYGRKRVFLAGVIGFAALSAACGAAPTLSVLIAARALQALFAALIVPTSLSLILPEFPPQRRPTAVATWGAMGAASAALGPTLGGLLTEYASWRWIFLINVPICALILILGPRMLAESRDPNAAGLPDLAGAALVAAIPALLSYAIIEGPARGWSDPLVIGGFVLAAVLLPVFLWRTYRAAHPVLDPALFRVPGFTLINTATLLFGVAFYATLLVNVLYLQTEWHYSVLRSALANTPAPLLVLLIARGAGKLSQRTGYRRVLLAGSIVWAIGMAGFALGATDSPHWATHWLPWTLLIGLGTGLTLPIQSASAVQGLTPRHFGQGSATNASFRQLGAVLGVSVSVAVASAATTPLAGYQQTSWIFAAAGLAAGVVPMLAGRHS